MAARLIAGLLLVLLLLVQAQLWWGRGSLPQVRQLREALDQQQARNQQTQWANEQLAAEVRDLTEGLEIIEEKARMELGMVAPGEVYVQFSRASTRQRGVSDLE
ncbi:MAG: hypothetical protein OHK0048_14530 [Rhodoferax sp.]